MGLKVKETILDRDRKDLVESDEDDPKDLVIDVDVEIDSDSRKYSSRLRKSTTSIQETEGN